MKAPMKPIVQNGDPVLRKKAEPVAVQDITSEPIQSLLRDMREALSEKERGIALAAPQVGESLRIFIVAEKAFEENVKDIRLTYINPTVKNISKKKENVEEGCLSVEGIFGTVPRAERITVEAYDEHGEKFTRGASGLLAQIFQHELDHLDGVLYTDRATETHEYPTEEVSQ